MATITFTPDNGGEPKVFDLGVLQTLSPAPETVADVVIENTDGTSETFEAVEAPAAEAVEDAPAA